MTFAIRRVILPFMLFGFATSPYAQDVTAPPPPNKPPVGSGDPAIFEPKALDLLKQNRAAMLRLHTYQAECRTALTRDKPFPNRPATRYQLATLRAAKPNRMRYDCWTLPTPSGSVSWSRPDVAPTYTFTCDGTEGWKQFGNVYRKDSRIDAKSTGTNLEPWIGFYSPDSSVYGSVVASKKSNELRALRLEGHETVEGVPCEKVFIGTESTYGGQAVVERATWYIDPDRLVRRCVRYVAFDASPGMTYDALLTNIKRNDPIDPQAYTYTPPPGVTLETPPKSVPLLASGTLAPDFTALDMDQRTVKLSDYRSKVVVLDFWASWCGLCMASMPHNQSVVKKLQSRGVPVVLLAVDDCEERTAFDSWAKKSSAPYPSLIFVHVSPSQQLSSKLYSVSGIPTQYVVDKNGVIRASFVGYGGPTSELEKAVKAAAVL